MNNLYGITNIKIVFMQTTDNNAPEINDFIKRHDGNIIDIQYQQNNFTCHQVMIIYSEN